MGEHRLEHEKLFVDSFIIRGLRERYLSKLSSAKNRRKFLDRLNHGFRNDLEGRFLSLADRAWPHHFQQCYLMADEEQYDGRLVSAADALVILGEANFGIVVSFIPGQLACYQDEPPSEVVWLERPQVG